MAATPAMSLEDAIAKFNAAFGTQKNCNAKPSYIDLLNMSTHAHANGQNYLASVLYRYAESAEVVA